MADSYDGLGDVSAKLVKEPALLEDLTLSHIKVARFFKFPGTAVRAKRMVEGVGLILKYTYYLVEEEQEELVEFFEQMCGRLNRFWLPIWKKDFTLAGPVSSGSTTVKITRCYFKEAFQGYERIWFRFKNGDNVVRKVASIGLEGDLEVLTLESPVDRQINDEDLLCFSRFVLVRFEEDTLAYDYQKDPAVAKAEVVFRELVQEYEDYSGIANPFAELYEFEALGEVFRVTSYWKDIERNGNVYARLPISRSTLERGLDIFADTRLDVCARCGEEFMRLMLNKLTVDTRIKLLRLDIETGQAQTIFVGNSTAATMKEDMLYLSFSPLGAKAKVLIPKDLYQGYCNHNLFDGGCGVNKASYAVTAQVTTDETNTTLYSSAFAAKPEGWFTGGFVEFLGESRLVMESKENYVIIQCPFSEPVDGQTVTAYPGCDKSPKTCKEKFDNLVNFLGCPYIPSRNPVLWGMK